MCKLIFAFLLSMMPFLSFAEAAQPVINTIAFQTSAEQWVNTKTAEVTVHVNATLTEDQLAKAHADILEKLNQLASADWHIIQFNRSPNESGLEQVFVQAQARLPESVLASMRSQAKILSKAGETFSIASINFVPTMTEVEIVRSHLRAEIYQHVQEELAIVNKMYPTLHYVAHEINFNESDMPQPMPRPNMMVATAERASIVGPLTVANKMVMSANVTLAASMTT